VITEMKVERGFVYFNLNGGDSWAYYHPENNPDYILNFKGEPAYLTKELLPDYWQQLTNTGSSTRTSSDGVLYWHSATAEPVCTGAAPMRLLLMSSTSTPRRMRRSYVTSPNNMAYPSETSSRNGT